MSPLTDNDLRNMYSSFPESQKKMFQHLHEEILRLERKQLQHTFNVLSKRSAILAKEGKIITKDDV